MSNSLKAKQPTPVQFKTMHPHTHDDLFMMATQRFCGTEEHDRLTSDQYREAFYLLISHVKSGTRQKASRLLSACPYTPRSVALYFALDTLQIAMPHLVDSMVLGQLDLLQIIESKGIDYALAIASRPDIGPSVVQRLRKFNSPSIDTTLDANPALVNEGENRTAHVLFNKIETGTDADVQEASVEPSVFVEPVGSAAEQLLTAAARGGRFGSSAGGKTAPSLPIPDFGKSLEKAAQAHSSQAMAALMQKRFGIEFDAAYQVLADHTGDTLAVLMKAAEIEPAQANRIQLLVHPEIGLSVPNAMRAIRFYERLKQVSCEEAVMSWPRIDEPSAVYQPLLSDDGPNAPRRESTHETTQPYIEQKTDRLTG